MKATRMIFVLAFSIGLATRAEAGLLAPTESVAGLTQNQWAEAWWNWAVSYPAASNPVSDPTGAFSSLGDQGQVFFLAGSFGGGPVTRTATVRNDQYLFFPLANGVTTELDSSYGPSDAEMIQDVIEFVGDGSNFFVELDGVDLSGGADLNGWLQTSPTAFLLNFPPGGIFTDDDYSGPIRSVQRGWWLMLAPLQAGKHTLKFGGTATANGIYAGFGPNVQDLTYELTVVPEPGTLGLAACAVVPAAAAALARSRRSRVRTV